MTASRPTVGGIELEALFLEARPAAPDAPRRAPLVLLHEGLGSVELWRSFPHDLRAATGDRAVLVYSRAGYGRSGPASMPRPVTYMHDEADSVLPPVLEHFGLERPVLVGHSDGASIALLYAGAGNPVAGLVLLAPHVFVEDVSVASIAAVRDDFATTDLRARLARYHDDVDNAFRGWNDAWLSPEFRSWNIEDRLAGVRCPVLVVQGEDDAYGTLGQVDAIERGVTGPVQRLILAGVGHAPHLEAPADTLAAVAPFVRALDGA